ncbi:MAG: alpha/beta hydrolase fold domain-containing protein [Planctomycetes bacterium]|nr:alpha/beta hydrolase fold domain-containing protein [Planctomycetota bacterium]
MRARKLALIAVLLLPGCLAPGPFSASVARVRRTEGIVYGAAPIQSPRAEFPLLLDLYEPARADTAELRPAVLLIHGGGFHGGGRGEQRIASLAEELAAAGCVVAAIDYRLAGQRPLVSPAMSEACAGMFRAPLRGGRGTENAAAAALEDALAACSWLRQNAPRLRLDAARFAAGGASAGAIAALGLAYGLDDQGVAAPLPVVVVLDLWGSAEGFLDCLERGEAALFIVHGEDDPVIPVARARELAQRAQEAGIPCELHVVAGAAHGLDVFATEAAPGATAGERLLRFLETHLAVPLRP